MVGLVRRRTQAWSVWPDTSSFSGREGVLRDIEERLSAEADGHRVVVLAGLPGVGKSWAAAAYARRHRDRYRIVWWLQGSDDASLVRDYGDLAHALDLPSAATAGPSMVAAVRARLAATDDWLLVFDDLPPDRLAAWLPPGRGGHVLVTSVDGTGDAVLVAPFREDEAAAFLLARTGSQDEAAARDVARLLGGLPLALQQAASCIPTEIASLSDYAERFRLSEGALGDIGTAPGHATVTVTLRVILDRLQASPEAVDLLCLAAYLAPQRIPRRALEGAGVTTWPGPWASSAGSRWSRPTPSGSPSTPSSSWRREPGSVRPRSRTWPPPPA
ncbi:MAG TPA: hypothetical protein VL337_04245 [Acidimicrobiales bacterium]|nr:hypothetical protein [Acidimicrobiales bacterium]